MDKPFRDGKRDGWMDGWRRRTGAGRTGSRLHKKELVSVCCIVIG